jgi:hypothetical protein
MVSANCSKLQMLPNDTNHSHYTKSPLPHKISQHSIQSISAKYYLLVMLKTLDIKLYGCSYATASD